MTIHIHQCKRCPHEWASKSEHPVMCPRCKTPYWDRERKKKKVDNNEESK